MQNTDEIINVLLLTSEHICASIGMCGKPDLLVLTEKGVGEKPPLYLLPRTLLQKAVCTCFQSWVSLLL